MRYYIEYALFRFCGFLVRSLPLETASRWSGAAWRAFAPYTRRHRRALAHIRIAYPDISDAERQKLALQMWDTMGRVFAESFRVDDLVASDRVHFADEVQAAQLFSKGNGSIACTAHQGNWEVAVVPLLRLGHKPIGIYQKIKNPYVDAMAQSLRAPLYPGGLLPKDRTTALAALRHVKNGGVLSIMADLRDNRGVRVPFFGREAASTPFPAMIAVTQDKPLIVAHVIREPNVRFRIELQEVDVVRTGDREADIAATTANLQAALERNVRARPGEWMWGHRRWG